MTVKKTLIPHYSAVFGNIAVHFLHRYHCCNREHTSFPPSFYHFRFSFLLINLSAFASAVPGVQQHDTGIALDISLLPTDLH